MSTISLHHYADVVNNNKESVSDLLMDMADFDLDFNGDNGEEYLREEAEGYESNAEYCLHVAKNENSLSAMIEKFIHMWMGQDGYYYDYSIEVIEADNKLFVSLVYLTR